MRKIPSLLVILALLMSAFAMGCATPVKKGTLVRCPSCGVEFPVEKGMREGK